MLLPNHHLVGNILEDKGHFSCKKSPQMDQWLSHILQPSLWPCPGRMYHEKGCINLRILHQIANPSDWKYQQTQLSQYKYIWQFRFHSAYPWDFYLHIPTDYGD